VESHCLTSLCFSLLSCLQEERFAFLAEWYDPSAALLRRYQLLFYPKDGSVEMFDVKNQRTFLRRTKYDELHQEDLFIGNRVNVFSRQLDLIGYGDQYTGNKLGSKKERTLAMVKPDAVNKMGDILQMIYDANLILTKAKMTKLTWGPGLCYYLLSTYGVPGDLGCVITCCQHMACQGAWAVLLPAVNIWRARRPVVRLPNVSRQQKALNVRLQTKQKGCLCVRIVCPLSMFFPSGGGFCNTLPCNLMPHVVSLTGKILHSISAAGFEISALQMFNMDRANAEEFLEVYKGVVTEYPSMVAELCSGPCMALEIRGTDAPKTFREFCGPADPEIARHLRPSSLRALYGKTKVQNAVHCTDLPEDGVLEVDTYWRLIHPHI
uniref:Nucleoside diphosphate kinase homolog 7 n=1 Tax=Salmo trutta TaxID=8032 RepID=A0A673WX28_SALTR